MVNVEVLDEVLAHILTQRLLDKSQIVLVVLFTKGHAQEGAEALGDIVSKPLAIQQRDHVVLVRHKTRLGDLTQVLS
ncbi:hypothetical protein D3C81_1702620 [compost metagenome]